jgi:two-component system, sensor histidine kinase and response regulator
MGRYRFYMSVVDPLTITCQDLNEETSVRVDSDGLDPVAVLNADILVAEDNPVNQEVAKMMLEMLGCRVEQAENGIKAVEMATTVKYDLILMDCQMPEMDGFEAVRLIREHEKNVNNPGSRRVTVIAMTGNTTDEDRDKCLTNGMDDFLKKPFAFEEMQEVVGRWLSIPGQASSSGNTEHNLKADDSPIEVRYIDNIIALQRKGAPDILAKVIDHYLSESPKMIERLDNAVEAGDGELIRSIAHSFKSGSANLGALRLAELCWEMERSAVDNSMVANRKILAFIDHEYEAVKSALTVIRKGERE